MLGLIKKVMLKNKQTIIRKRFPELNITLHVEMPSPSMDKMVEVAQLVNLVNSFESRISALTDGQLAAKTDEFKEQLKNKSEKFAQEAEELQQAMLKVAMPEEKEKLKEKLKISRNRIFTEILPEAFAVVREASKRTIGLRHFDVQIIGGIILHEGRIAEMSTGEGKTLVATLAAYLNALLGKGVHIVTVNDYLARRDREWMGPIYEFLGLSVGTIQHDMSDEERKIAYACDITYGTNNEFGFDYLRDNMKYSITDLVQRSFYYAIVDEVDSILIDEARTPLIISGPAEESTEKYYTAKKIADQLKGRRTTENDGIDAKYKGVDLSAGFDYLADEKAKTISLTKEGEAKAERIWGIESFYNPENQENENCLALTLASLRAKEFFERDVDYVIKDGEVIIVDEFTGRLMPGRRWSDGLHQAVESKEGLKIERENQTLATITFQNYFRMYEKLAGMTGTAFTEANEFKSIYQLDVVVLPTNQPLVRKNYPDRIYKTEEEKFAAVVEEIAQLSNLGKPVLVGTITIDKSERLSEMLKRRGIKHQVLNAKYHEMEAQIIAQAGSYKGVTIATNMAGRGTDILLGGSPEFVAKNVAKQKLNLQDTNYLAEYKKILDHYKSVAAVEHKKVVELGGLHVLGTERHEARRIDNQLRGRSGRQGDPGSSRFYVSLKDDLMRLFGSDRIIGLMEKLGLEEGQVIEHPWVSGSIEIAQRRVEQHNFEIRKQLLEYDNVMNKQREIIYGRRRQILEGFSLREDIIEIISRLVEDYLKIYKQPDSLELDSVGLISFMSLNFGLQLDAQTFNHQSDQEVKEKLTQELLAVYENKEKLIGQELLRNLERMVFLQTIDRKWKDHLYELDCLREGIGLRAYGQRDPLIEYKGEAFGMFSQMISAIDEDAVQTIYKLESVKPERFQGVFSSLPKELSHPELAGFPDSAPAEGAPESARATSKHTVKPVQLHQPKVGRNEPCPCGSGKKYKKCCGE